MSVRHAARLLTLLALGAYLVDSRRESAQHQELVVIDPEPFIPLAKDFDVNEDFVSLSTESLAKTFREERDKVTYGEFLKLLKQDSDGKMSIIAIGDKLMLSAIVDNINSLQGLKPIQQMPVLLWARRSQDGSTSPLTLKSDVSRFVRDQASDSGFEFVLKPTHLSSGQGVLVMSHEKWLAEEWTVEKLLAHVDKVLELRTSPDESLALQATMPGMVVQPKYPAPPLGSLSHYGGHFRKEDDSAPISVWHKLLQDAVWKDNIGAWVSDRGHHKFIFKEPITCADGLQLKADETLVDRVAHQAQAKPLQICNGTTAYDLDFGNMPIEIRVQVVWGRAYIGILWFGAQNTGNAYLSRDSSGAWKAKYYPFSSGVFEQLGKLQPGLHLPQGQRQELAKLLEQHMPKAAEQAERMAKALKAPWLRVDFFVPPGDGKDGAWGLRMNEVAYGSGVLYFDHEEGAEWDSLQSNDLPAILQRESSNVAWAAAQGYLARTEDSPTTDSLEAFGTLGCRLLAGGSFSNGTEAYRQLRCFRGSAAEPPRDY